MNNKDNSLATSLTESLESGGHGMHSPKSKKKSHQITKGASQLQFQLPFWSKTLSQLPPLEKKGETGGQDPSFFQPSRTKSEKSLRSIGSKEFINYNTDLKDQLLRKSQSLMSLSQEISAEKLSNTGVQEFKPKNTRDRSLTFSDEVSLQKQMIGGKDKRSNMMASDGPARQTSKVALPAISHSSSPLKSEKTTSRSRGHSLTQRKLPKAASFLQGGKKVL